MFNRTIEYYEHRIKLMKARGEVVNSKLIKKLERKIRQLKEADA